jgi:hypothetical protein
MMKQYSGFDTGLERVTDRALEGDARMTGMVRQHLDERELG